MSSMDLYNILQNSSFQENMHEIGVAYHVTDRKVDENNYQEDYPPDFNELKWGIAKDNYYDQRILGLPCVFFTTSLFGQKLPITSPYPAEGDAGSRYWRVKVPMSEFNDYQIWYCQDPASTQSRRPRGPSFDVFQVRLILTQGPREAGFLKGIPGIIPLNKGLYNPFLYRHNGRWYSNDYFDSSFNDLKYVVNFAVLKSFPLYNFDWDQVTRLSNIGPGDSMDSDETADLLLEQWSLANRASC